MADNSKGLMNKDWEKIQIRTFTKWANNHILKRWGADAAIKDLIKDFETGIKLMELLSALYGATIPKHNKTPKSRPQKLDNIELAFRMLDELKVKTHFLKPTHLVDCDQTMLLGMIWAIILDFQIKGISVEELSAKEGLLLWCKKKTAGYRDVKVENFTNSWVDGLAFCALIHKHRPDLLDFDPLDKKNAKHNLNLAFDVAEKHLGIPRLLEPEDLLDVARPDERSIVTYISEYFHCFASQNQSEAAGRRIAKLVAFEKSTEQMQNDYNDKARELLSWIEQTTQDMASREYGNTLEAAEQLWSDLTQYKKKEKPSRTNQKLTLEETFNNLQAKLRVNNRPLFTPAAELSLQNIDQKWQGLGTTETERADWLRKEIERMQKLENLASKFWNRAKALLSWCSENVEQLEGSDVGDSLAAVEAKSKVHEGFKASFKTTFARYTAVEKLGRQLIDENYGKKTQVSEKLGELSKAIEKVESSAKKREEKLAEELERQRRFEEMRLKFATSSRTFVSALEDCDDLLSDPVRTTSKKLISEISQNFQHFVSHEHQENEKMVQNLRQLNKEMTNENVTTNMYAQFTMAQVEERWERTVGDVERRKEEIQEEEKRQDSNESLCKSFASKSKIFSDFCAEKRDAAGSVKGSLEEQLNEIKNLEKEVAQKGSGFDELAELSRQMDEAAITHNPFTETTVDQLKMVYNGLRDLLAKQSGVLEAEQMKQSGSKVAPEQLAEFKETFKQFDKNGTGELEKHEFKACLSALGHPSKDDIVDQIVNSIGKTVPNKIVFAEFVEYMVSKTEDSDSPQTIKSAFKTIAGEKDLVSEEELKRVFGGDQETLNFLMKKIPKKNGLYDYAAFVNETYGN